MFIEQNRKLFTHCSGGNHSFTLYWKIKCGPTHNFWILCTLMIRTQEHTTFVSGQVLLGTRTQALVWPSQCTQVLYKTTPFLLSWPLILLVQYFSGEGCTLVWSLVLLCNPERWAIASLFSYNPGKEEKKRKPRTHMWTLVGTVQR